MDGMVVIRLQCAQCKAMFERAASHVNRSRAIGAPLYCSMKCAGLARRLKNPQTDAERRAAKKAYDVAYRAKNLLDITAKKIEYFQRTYDPAKAAIERKARMPKHVEYCRQPEYVAYKAQYDAQYRAKEYGQFADAYRLLLDLEKEIRRQATKYERYVAKGYYTRNAQKRRRELWAAMKRN